MISYSMSGFPAFILHFGSALALLLIFVVIYVRTTPYREIALIREGNVAAGISLGGAILGFSFVLASATANSVSWIDMLIWSVIGLVVQLGAYFISRAVFPEIAQAIKDNRVAPAIFLAALSLALGLLNAASMTY